MELFDGGGAHAQTTKMWNSRQHLVVLLTIIAAVLYAPEARTDALDNLAREVCFKVHGADAQSIRKYEQEKLFAALRVLKARTEDKRRIADDAEADYKFELQKVEDIKLEIQKLEYLQQYTFTFRAVSISVNEKSEEIVKLKSNLEKEDDEIGKQKLRHQINTLQEEIDKLAATLQKDRMKDYTDEMVARFGKMNLVTPYLEGSRISWQFGPEYTQKIAPRIEAELDKARPSLPQAEQKTAPYRRAFVAALVELKESMKVLGFMERVIRETEACRADAKSIAPRRDFSANFKISCRSPEFDAPACGHGTMWINFDEQGRATGQAGLSRVCVTGLGAPQCLEQPTAQVTQATGQIAANHLTATVTYILPSNRPRKDTGIFRFEGQVTSDGNIMPIGWRGSGSLTTTENKYPLPPDSPYAINCSGQWTTETVLACWDE